MMEADMMLLALESEEEAMSHGNAALELGKNKGMDCPLEPLEGMQPSKPNSDFWSLVL